MHAAAAAAATGDAHEKDWRGIYSVRPNGKSAQKLSSHGDMTTRLSSVSLIVLKPVGVESLRAIPRAERAGGTQRSQAIRN